MKTIKLLFSSLYSNASAMEGRFQKWYLAVILFFLSLIIAVIPLFVTTINVNGSDFMNGTLYSVDNGFQRFTEELYQNDVILEVKQDDELYQGRPYLQNSSTDWNDVFIDYEQIDSTKFHYFKYHVDHVDITYLKVYFQRTASNADSALFITSLLDKENSATNINTTINTFLFLGTNEVYLYIYNSTKVNEGLASGKDYVQAFQGTYHNVPVGTNIKMFGARDGAGVPFDPSEIPPSDSNDYLAYQNRLFNDWANFYDDLYSYNKMIVLWTTTGIMLAVNTALALLMSLLIFVLTRGKNNPNRTLKFFESFKIGAWLLLSPALLTLIIGFIFPNYAPMAFILILGLRMMWLSSKNLRPQYVQSQQKK
jgi:hypothetical protein